MRVLFFIGALVVVLTGCNKLPESEVPPKEAEATDVAPSSQAESAQPPIDPWKYNTKSDEMRGITTKYASLISENSVYFGFPYDGGSELSITLRKTTKEPSDVMFVISKGQFSCDTISGRCYASFKFDDQPLQEIRLSGSTDHSSDILFIHSSNDTEQFIKSLKSAKSLIIELPFYQEGHKQFKFKLPDLDWPTSESKSAAKSAKSAMSSDAAAAAADAVAAAEDLTAIIDSEIDATAYAQ